MYIKTNGIQLFYEKYGQGTPIILLHRNGEDHTIFDVLIKQLESNYTVYAIDSRDHGKSSKVDSLDYKVMMEDIASFIQRLEIEKPILYGFSDGGIIGLLLAIEYPQMLSKLIISGANTTPDCLRTLYGIYIKITYFFTRSSKIKLMLTQPNIDKESLKKILTPTLILAGSKDLIREDHTRAIASSIQNSVLNIIEGEGHGSYVIHSEKLYKIVKLFLES